MQDFIVEGVQQGRRGGGGVLVEGQSATFPQPARDLAEHCKHSQWHSMVSHILSSALDGIFCCILWVFCTKELYAVQCEKGSFSFSEAKWNSNCDSTLRQVQLANAQTRHSYTSKKLWLPMVGSDPT